MKEYLSKLGRYALDFEISLWGGIAVYALALYPIEIAFELTATAEMVIRALLGAIGTTITIFFVSRRSGYDNKVFRLTGVLIPVLSVLCVQQIVAPILQYIIYVAGTAKECAQAIYMLKGDFAYNAPRWLYHVCMVFLDIVLFLPSTLFGEYMGAKKRQKDRDELISQKR